MTTPDQVAICTTRENLRDGELDETKCKKLLQQPGQDRPVNYYDLLDLATDMGVWVDVDDVGWLPAQSKGGWFDEHDLILLARNLNPVEETCTLAHELGHAVLGHTADVDGWFAQRQERAADQWAARLLVSPAEYEAAERLHGPHMGGIAHELGVTTHILATWQDLYERRPYESQRHQTPSASKI